jgi:hypothetical protein
MTTAATLSVHRGQLNGEPCSPWYRCAVADFAAIDMHRPPPSTIVGAERARVR